MQKNAKSGTLKSGVLRIKGGQLPQDTPMSFGTETDRARNCGREESFDGQLSQRVSWQHPDGCIKHGPVSSRASRQPGGSTNWRSPIIITIGGGHHTDTHASQGAFSTANVLLHTTRRCLKRRDIPPLGSTLSREREVTSSWNIQSCFLHPQPNAQVRFCRTLKV